MDSMPSCPSPRRSLVPATVDRLDATRRSFWSVDVDSPLPALRLASSSSTRKRLTDRKRHARLEIQLSFGRGSSSVFAGALPITFLRHLRKRSRSQGPSLHRHDPASTVVCPCPTPAKRRPPTQL